MIVADPTQASLLPLRELCVLCVKTHPQPRPALSRCLAAKPRRICISAKPTHNPFRIRSFKTQDLKLFRMRSYEKNRGRGVLLSTRNSTKNYCPEEPSGVRGPLIPSLNQRFRPCRKGSDPIARALPFRRSRRRASHCSLATTLYALRFHRAIALKKGWQRLIAY